VYPYPCDTDDEGTLRSLPPSSPTATLSTETMRTDRFTNTTTCSKRWSSLFVLLALLQAISATAAAPADPPLILDYAPSPPPDEGPPASADALRDPKFLPAQIGSILGSYAVCLVLVATGLLVLARRRRDHLRAAEDSDLAYPVLAYPGHFVEDDEPLEYGQFPYPIKSPTSAAPNFSYPDPHSPTRTERSELPQYIFPSPTSTGVPGTDPHVDQIVVARDHMMAQSQLEDMYKHVMEQEAAKEAGVQYTGPEYPAPNLRSPASQSSTLSKKERNKPSSLNFAGGNNEKPQSRTSSIFSALRSPRKKTPKALNISSPIMTPMSGTFPQVMQMQAEEMGPLSPRHYAPPPPPPIPASQPAPPSRQRRNTNGSLPTPDISPQSTLSIDERIAHVVPRPTPRIDTFPAHVRGVSVASSGNDPVSAQSERSTAPLVGLPTSPKPGVNRFPSLSELPKSPVPGQSFPRLQQQQQQPAGRTNNSLPLRAYEPSLASPSYATQTFTTKQTVFERKAPMSPGGMRTPWTGAPTPYSPYQPFSPVIPITPSLVTKEDRKRMKRMEPKTPTVAMVKNSDDIW
jgi:hypothetical protein